uniref:E3 ubiquitin-protein ligase PPP1R11 n=1 Tax=Heterorhabditis bacteriophora TaxID=37862 RepID=A0A1I7XFZ1_HETBA
MATTTRTEPVQTSNSDQLILRLGKPSEVQEHHVAWTIDTVDNEHMGKKKSKCCCIYKKRKNWQESSSDNDSV